MAPANDPSPIFEGGKLKPGIYKIQNIVGQTYLENGKGLWEILPSGPGYTIRRVDPGKPKQYCMMLNGLGGTPISVSAFAVPWRVTMVKEDRYRGHEYVRIFWGTTNKTWDLADYGSDRDRTQVKLEDNNGFQACRIWKLIPVPQATSVNPTTKSDPLPPYKADP